MTAQDRHRTCRIRLGRWVVRTITRITRNAPDSLRNHLNSPDSRPEPGFWPGPIHWRAGGILALAGVMVFGEPAGAPAQTNVAVVVRHAPALNGGRIEGALQQLAGENATLNGGAAITGDWLVPGTPTVRTNGHPDFQGVLAGPGQVQPAHYSITLNGAAHLRYLRTRMDPATMAAVIPPAPPPGTRQAILNQPGQSAGDFATLGHLTLNGNVGLVAVPPGNYGRFTANGAGGFVLGTPGATLPAVYGFENLTFNGNTEVRLAGPVIVTVANGFTANGRLGGTNQPGWLQLNVVNGGLTLNGGSTVAGWVRAPNGTVIINGNSLLLGTIACDRFILNGGGVVRWSGAGLNQGPVVAAGPDQILSCHWLPVTVALAGSVRDDGLPPAQPVSATWSQLSGPAGAIFADPHATNTLVTLPQAGAYKLELTATDGEFTGSNQLTLTLTQTNQPPTATKAILTTAEDTPIAVTLTGTDVDGDQLQFHVSNPPLNGLLSGTAPNLIYTPNTNYSGPDSFTFQISDGQTNSLPATVSIAINPVNDDPVIRAPSMAQVFEDSLLVLGGTNAIQVSDVDVGDGQARLSLSVSNGVLWISVTNGIDWVSGTNGLSSMTIAGTLANLNAALTNLTYLGPTNYWGTNGLWVTVDDQGHSGSGGALVASALIAINVFPVNDAPIALFQLLVTDEDTPLPFTLTGSDVDGDALTFTVVSDPTNGVLTGVAPNLVYHPNTNNNHPGTIAFTVSDGSLTSYPDVVHIQVNPVNDAPVIAAPGAQTVNAGQALVFDDTNAIRLSDVDAGDGLLLLSMTASNGTVALSETNNLSFISGTNGTSAIVASGTLSDLNAALSNLRYVGLPGFSGSDTLVITVNDQGNTGYGGSLVDTQTISVAVSPVNQSPMPATTGTDFWVGRLAGTESTRMRYIMLLADQDTSVNLISPDGTAETLDLEAGVPLTYWLEALLWWDPIIASDTVLRTAFHVTSTEPISVFVVDFAPNDSDAYRILPTPVLGTNYVVATYRNFQLFPGRVFGSQFSVTAVADDTRVTIVPAVATSGHGAGQPFTVILQEGETYNLRHTETAAGDLTGSLVTADKPVAVLGGEAWATIPPNTGYGSLIAEQLLPVELWDSEYVVLRLAGRSGYAVRILAAQDNTEIRLPGIGQTNLNRGQYWELFLTNDLQVVASRPAAVCQYAFGDVSENLPGNPAMIWVPGVHQGLTDCEWMTPETYMTLFFGRMHAADLVYTNYVNLVLPSGALDSLTINATTFGEYGDLFWDGEWNYLTINGNALPANSSARVIGDGKYVGVSLPIENGVYRIHCSEPVLTVQYGFLSDVNDNGPDTYGLPGPFTAPKFPLDVRIAVASPTDGSVVQVGAETFVVAEVIDPRQLVTNVEFRVDGVKLSEGATTNFAWSPTQSASYALQLVAATLNGQSVTSSPVHVTAVTDFTSEGVLIASPYDGQSVYISRPTPIALAFNDPTGLFDHAEFFANSVSLGQTTNTTFNWMPSETNDYLLQAIVYDHDGNACNTANTVTVHVIPPPRPVVRITSPAEGSRVRAGVGTFVIASLNDPGLLTTNVEFYVDGAKVSENTTYFAWTPTQLGSHVLHCVALTADGDRITSTLVNVTVAEMYPPVVNLLSPTNDEWFASGAMPLLRAQAADSDGSISNLTLTLDYMVLRDTNDATLEVLATNVIPGWHEAVAQAADNDGLSASSQSIRFFIERGENAALPVPDQLAAAALSATQIQLSWLPIATNEWTQSFLVERWSVTNSLWTEIAGIPAASTHYLDSDLNPETNYRYRMACVDANGNRSAYSAETNATTRTTVPNYAVIDLSASLAGLLTNRVPGGNILTNSGLMPFDIRRTVPLGTRHAETVLGTNAATLSRAVARFTEQWPQIQLDYDPVLLSPHSFLPRLGYLTGPGGSGVTVSEAAAQRFDPADPDRPVKAFLQEHQALFGFGPEAITNAAVKRDYVSPVTGARTVVWQQQVGGVPVFNALFIGHVTSIGELAGVACDFIPAPTPAANPAVVAAVLDGSEFPVTSAQALLAAVANVGDVFAVTDITSLSGAQGVTRNQSYTATKGIKGEAHVELTWFPASRNELKLARQVLFTSQWRNEMYLTLVSAENNEILYRRNLTADSSDASYRVYTANSPAPMSPGLPIPGTTQAPLVDRSLVTFSALDAVASPNGWIADGGNETRGNNVDAHLDRNDDNLPDLPRPTGNPFRVFDFPLDLAWNPSGYGDAVVVQLFYWNNWMHDALYRFGFTEPAGNFQNDNFGRGGFDGDAVQADAQDGLSLGDRQHHNNANMSTPPDGFAPRMQMYVFDGPAPGRDGSLDAEIILHEYTHGLSGRLVGGGAGIDALQTAGMGEGWSDFYALALLTDSAADVDAPYPVGAYAAYHGFGTFFDQNYYYGIRHYPYCTDTNRNPLTFADIDPGQAGAHAGAPRNPLTGSFRAELAGEAHNQGEVWCMMLWEMRANLVKKHGYEKGNSLALQLVTDGLRLSPPNPNYVQARDAILLADRMLSNGADAPEIWAAFTKRGLGYDAKAPCSYTTVGIQESHTPAPALVTERVEIRGGNGNGIIETNEDNSLLIVVHNQGTGAATQVSAQITTATPGVQILQAQTAYEDIPPNESRPNTVWLPIRTLPEFVDGTPIDLTFVITSDQHTVTNTLRFYPGGSGPKLPDNDNFAAAPTSDSAGTKDLTPYDLGNLEPLWMADDGSCLLMSTAGPGRYVLWKPDGTTADRIYPGFMAHRLGRNGLIVGQVQLPDQTDQFGHHIPQTAAAWWAPGDPVPTIATPDIYAYKFPKTPNDIFARVGVAFSTNNSLATNYFVGSVSNYFPVNLSWWDVNAAGQAAGAAGVYLRPYDPNGNGIMDVYLGPSPSGGLVYTNEIIQSAVEKIQFDAAGQIGWFNFNERGFNAGYFGSPALTLYYNALSCTASRFEPASQWRWLGPMKQSSAGLMAGVSLGLLIGDDGTVVGCGGTCTGIDALDALVPTHAFRWRDQDGEYDLVTPKLTDMGVLPGGAHSYPRAMNATGHVAGNSDLDALGAGGVLAAYWSPTNTQPENLQSLGPVQNPRFPNGYSDAFAINDFTNIVGASLKADGSSAAVLWQRNHNTNGVSSTNNAPFWEINDLNLRLNDDDWRVNYAVGLNRDGLILAAGFKTDTNQTGFPAVKNRRATLLVPVAVKSRDRFFTGIVELPAGVELNAVQVSFTLKQGTTSEVLAVLNPQERIYASRVLAILGRAESRVSDRRPAQEVVLYRDPLRPRQLHFAGCSPRFGTLQVDVTMQTRSWPTINHELERDAEFCEFAVHLDIFGQGDPYYDNPEFPSYKPPLTSVFPGIEGCQFIGYVRGQHYQGDDQTLHLYRAALTALLLDSFIEDYAKLPLVKLRGGLSGLTDGIVFDWQSIVEVGTFGWKTTPAYQLYVAVYHRERVLERAQAVDEFLQFMATIKAADIPVMAKNLGRTLYAQWTTKVQADTGWFYNGQSSGSNPEILKWYTEGYITGFAGEQLSLAALTAGITKYAELPKVALECVHMLDVARGGVVGIAMEGAKTARAGLLATYLTYASRAPTESWLRRLAQSPFKIENGLKASRFGNETLDKLFEALGQKGVYEADRVVVAAQHTRNFVPLQATPEMLELFQARYSEVMAKLEKELLPGSWVGTEALVNILDNLFPPGQADRVADLIRALDIENNPLGRQCLVETLAAASGKSSDEILSQGLKVSEKIKDVYPKMYHYADKSTLLDYATDKLDGIQGSWMLKEKIGGRYIGPEDLASQAAAKDRFQLPKKLVNGVWIEEPTCGRFKCIIETVDVADDCRIPRGWGHSAGTQSTPKEWLESVVKDNPARGTGNGIQFTQEKPVKVTVIDLKTGQTVRDKAHLRQLLQDYP